MRRTLPLAVLIVGLGAGPAVAFDCSRARTDVEIAICGDGRALAANDRMEAAYFALRDALGDPGRQILLDGQRAWLRFRNRSCGPAAGCLAEASRMRVEALEKTPAGTVPFFLWQGGVENGYKVKISGYRFAEPSVPAEAAYNGWVEAQIADTPYGRPPQQDGEAHAPWSRELSIDLGRLTGRLISGVAHSYDYSGGAHPNSWSASINLDRSSGEALSATELFGREGLKALTDACSRQIVEHYSDLYGDLSEDEALARLEQDFPGVVADHAGNMTRWHFDAQGAVIRFDSYAVAPYSAGPADCRFGYAEIRSLARDAELFSASR